MPLPHPLTDGDVTIRAPRPADAAVLVAARDDVTRRFLGEGDGDPRPLAVIEVAGAVVGWVDHDTDPEHSWLEPGECNVGYQLAADHRGRGIATRAVRLLLRHLAAEGRHRVATFLIDPANLASQALATRVGAHRVADLDGNPYFKLPITPPPTAADRPEP